MRISILREARLRARIDIEIGILLNIAWILVELAGKAGVPPNVDRVRRIVLSATNLLRAGMAFATDAGRASGDIAVSGNVECDVRSATPAPGPGPVVLPPHPMRETPGNRVVIDNPSAAPNVDGSVDVTAGKIIDELIVIDVEGESAVLVAKSVVVEAHVVKFVMAENHDAAVSAEHSLSIMSRRRLRGIEVVILDE